ncbi:winged helix-turn-helix domain-containing protein [Candidatus Nitrosotalea okcheonensis]|uniref:Transcriptional regulator, ArsR family n=1 Tax=Candidatus Nitrosotalea okcheonensis TaxID=1903276 RepID=A0A2H1FDN9_9ARCH|nr:winged helix-turn-helix domain-containing protein [Candidatus Nitrosotalea okcheonensis]SMH70892.1 Transcriptional regulator, ArsR family [Candidatus Nitrosotalea okcheonensis]
MSTLLQKELKISKILSTNADQAKALDDAARIKILQILYHKQFATEQIVEELNKIGYRKATTTIRHHLDILKNAGLIEIVKMEEVRGAVMKYYGTSVRVMGTKLPANFETEFSKTIADTSVKLEKVIKNIAENTGSKIKKKNSKNVTAESNYEEQIVMEIVNRAMTRVFENNGQLLLQK